MSQPSALRSRVNGTWCLLILTMPGALDPINQLERLKQRSIMRMGGVAADVQSGGRCVTSDQLLN
jgi:hypothetical protein